MTPEINTHDLLVTFGKHKGERWTRLPIGYLKWLVNEHEKLKNFPDAELHRDIALAELKRRGTVLESTMKISKHAIDRASLNCRGIWKETRKDDNEGLNSWLERMANEALESSDE